MVVGMSTTRIAGRVQPCPAARTNLWGSATGVAERGGGGSAPAEGGRRALSRARWVKGFRSHGEKWRGRCKSSLRATPTCRPISSTHVCLDRREVNAPI